jgi:hypothetical protein
MAGVTEGLSKLAGLRTALPSNGAIAVEVYAQEDGGIIVATAMDNGGFDVDTTCVYCGEGENRRKLGCCGKGESPVADCTTGSFHCEPTGFNPGGGPIVW